MNDFIKNLIMGLAVGVILGVNWDREFGKKKIKNQGNQKRRDERGRNK